MSSADGLKEDIDFKRVVNEPFDEVYEVENSEDVPSSLAVTPQPPSSRAGLEFNRSPLREEQLRFAPGETPPESPAMSNQDYYGDDPLMGEEDELTESGSLTESSDDEEAGFRGMQMEGAYDPAQYSDLQVKGDVEDLFQFISAYEPEVYELETELKPFIPDYIPAVGDIDAFIKIPRPDGQPTSLGLQVVDEPCADQSNETVLDLHLRTIAKTTAAKTLKKNEVKDAEENPKAIDNWIESISQVHRDKQPQTVHYNHKMPDIDTLMQEWPEEVEQVLSTIQLPSAELDVDIKDYTDLICAMFDIPSKKNRIQALHLLFTLFVEFRNSQHFGVETGLVSANAGADSLNLVNE